ncbi:MAG: hypothetical protein ACLRVU_09690 [Beduini sp.]|uniref:hypothetical protein n=1 Tax=Beduini sp. TaxID=1922300 RepID=UPI0039A108B9
MDKWVEKLNLMPLEMGLERHGDTVQNRIIFYQTFIDQSVKKIQQFELESRLKIQPTLSDDEYLELCELRDQAFLTLRELERGI